MYKVIEGIEYKKESGTIIDPMYAVLEFLGLFSKSKDLFAGMSCLAFRISLDRSLRFASTALYNWSENWLATDFLGIYSEMYSSFTADATFPLYREKMIEKMMESIDVGIPAILWSDGFKIACGYDREKEEFSLLDGESAGSLDFSSFGKSQLPVWYAHFFTRDRIEMDDKEIYLESLLQAVYKFQLHDRSLPKEDYACGGRVYDFIIKALRRGTYCRDSFKQTLLTFTCIKGHMVRYFTYIQEKIPGLSPIKNDLNQFYGHLKEMERDLHAQKSVTEFVGAFAEAKQLEGNILSSIEEAFQEDFANRFGRIGLR